MNLNNNNDNDILYSLALLLMFTITAFMAGYFNVPY